MVVYYRENRDSLFSIPHPLLLLLGNSILTVAFGIKTFAHYSRCGIVTTPEPRSDDIARLLYDNIYKKETEYPKLVINEVHRSKLDVNDEQEAGTLNQDLSMAIYDRYQSLISEAIESFNGDNKRGLLVSVHTYCDDEIAWTSLGKKRKMSHVMRLWHFSSSVNSFFKRACAAIQWG